MCWRQHPDSRKNSYGACRECHRLRMQRYRTGRPSIKRPRYRLRIDVYHRLKLKNQKANHILTELAGVPPETFSCWLHGARHKGGAVATSTEYAVALSAVLRVSVEGLFEKVG